MLVGFVYFTYSGIETENVTYFETQQADFLKTFRVLKHSIWG